MEFLSDPHLLWKYKESILAEISIVELMTEYGLKLEIKETGQFTHRTHCPFHVGKSGGAERTPSCFISNRTNSFYCFGCSSSGSPIEFVSFIDGTPPIVALTKLAKKIGFIDKDGKWDELKLDASTASPRFDPLKTIEPFLFEISTSLRNYIKIIKNTPEFDKEFRWIEKVGRKVDDFVSNIGHEDWEYAQDLCNKVKKSIDNRIKKGKK